MANVKTTTLSINGAAAEAVQTVAVADPKRKYIGLYAHTGSCKVSLGEGTHASTYITIAQGNLFELAINTIDKIQYSTTGTVLRVIQDISSNVCLTSDSLILTYDGSNLYYNGSVNKLAIPVFS